MGSPRLRSEYLARGAEAIAKYFRGFKADAFPLIDREKAREEILDDAVTREMSKRGTRQLFRGRVEAILGRRGILTLFVYEFWRLAPDVDGRVIESTIKPSNELVDRYRSTRQ